MNGLYGETPSMPNVLLIGSGLENCSVTALGLLGQASDSFVVTAAPGTTGSTALQTDNWVVDNRATEFRTCDAKVITEPHIVIADEVNIAADLAALAQSELVVEANGDEVARIGFTKIMLQLGTNANTAAGRMVPGAATFPSGRCIPCHPFRWIAQIGGSLGVAMTWRWVHPVFQNAITAVLIVDAYRYVGQMPNFCLPEIYVSPDGTDQGPILNIQNSSMLSRLNPTFVNQGCGPSSFMGTNVGPQGLA